MVIEVSDIDSVIADWDTSLITGLSLNDPVSSIPDAIAGWNLTAATTTRAIYKPTGINSLPAVQHDGVDDYFVTGSSKSITAPNIGSIAVLYFPTNKDYSALGILSGSSGVPSYLGSTGMTSLSYSSGSALVGDSTGYITGASITAAANMMLTSLFGELESYQKRNGKFSGGALTGAAHQFVSGSYYAGFGRSSLASSAFHGMLARWVLFAETQLCEHSYVEGILAHKYGITLPASHQFYAAAPTSPPSAGGNPMTAFQHGFEVGRSGAL